MNKVISGLALIAALAALGLSCVTSLRCSGAARQAEVNKQWMLDNYKQHDTLFDCIDVIMARFAEKADKE